MEVSALEQGDSHGAKIVAANLCPNERRPIRFGLGGMSLHLAECMIPVLLAKKDVADSTCRLHSRDLPQPFEHALVIIGDAAARSCVRIANEHPDRKDVIGPKSGVYFEHFHETANQQACVHEQDERERKLSANCAPTSNPCIGSVLVAVLCCPVFSNSCGSPAENRRAGTNPNARLQSSASKKLKATTAASMRVSSSRGMFTRGSATIRRTVGPASRKTVRQAGLA